VEPGELPQRTLGHMLGPFENCVAHAAREAPSFDGAGSLGDRSDRKERQRSPGSHWGDFATAAVRARGMLFAEARRRNEDRRPSWSECAGSSAGARPILGKSYLGVAKLSRASMARGS
jgi:hypothetical protein